MRIPSRFAALAALALAAEPLAAQEGRPRDEPRNAIGVQPIGLLYNVFTLDYERLVGNGMSLGVGGSWYARGRVSPFWDENFQTGARAVGVDAKWRYYLADTAFSGVALVLQAGSYGRREYARDDDRLAWRHSPTVGVGFEYTSRSRGQGATAVTFGLGAKRTLDGRDVWSLPTGALIVRLAVAGLF